MQEKSENITKIIERLSEYIDYKGISFNQLSKKINVSNSYFSKMVKNKGSLGEEIIKKIVLYYDDINPIWLLTGEGEMFKEEKQEKQPKQTRFGNKDCEFCKLKDQLIAAQSQTIELLEEKLSKCCPQQEECEKNESEAG